MKTRLASLLSMLLIGLVASAAFAAGSPDGAARGQKYWQRVVQKLNLTSDQQSKLQPVFQARMQQMKANHDAFKSQFNAILTPDQQAKVAQIQADAKAAHQNHQKFDRRSAMKSLNLTDAQKAQMKSFRDQNKAQMKSQQQQFVAQVESVLDANQKATFEQMMAHKHGHRGNKGNKGDRDQAPQAPQSNDNQ